MFSVMTAQPPAPEPRRAQRRVLKGRAGTLLGQAEPAVPGLKVCLSVFYSKKMKVLEALIGMIQKFSL